MPFNAYNGDLYVRKTYVKSRTQTTSDMHLLFGISPCYCLNYTKCPIFQYENIFWIAVG